MNYINTEIYYQLIRDVKIFRGISGNGYNFVYKHFKSYLEELGLSTKQKKFAKYPLALRRNAMFYAFKYRLRDDIMNIISALESDSASLPADDNYRFNYYMNNFNYIRECLERWHECLNIKVVETRKNDTDIVVVGRPVAVIWQRWLLPNITLLSDNPEDAINANHDIDWRPLMHFAKPTTTKNPTISYGWAQCSMSELDDLCLTISIFVDDREEQK